MAGSARDTQFLAAAYTASKVTHMPEKVNERIQTFTCELPLDGVDLINISADVCWLIFCAYPHNCVRCIIFVRVVIHCIQ